MKAKSMSLALATLPLLSPTSAFAQDVVVESAAPVVTTTSGATCAPGFIGSASNVLTAPVSFGTNLVDNIFNPPGSWFELNVLGAGFSLGGRRNVVQTNGIPSAYYLNGAAPNLIGDRGFYRTSNYAAVIPGSVSLGNPRPVPRCLVVKNASNAFSRTSSGMPGPRSAMTTRQRASVVNTATAMRPFPSIACAAFIRMF